MGGTQKERGKGMEGSVRGRQVKEKWPGYGREGERKKEEEKTRKQVKLIGRERGREGWKVPCGGARKGKNG